MELKAFAHFWFYVYLVEKYRTLKYPITKQQFFPVACLELLPSPCMIVLSLSQLAEFSTFNSRALSQTLAESYETSRSVI